MIRKVLRETDVEPLSLVDILTVSPHAMRWVIGLTFVGGLVTLAAPPDWAFLPLFFGATMFATGAACVVILPILRVRHSFTLHVYGGTRRRDERDETELVLTRGEREALVRLIHHAQADGDDAALARIEHGLDHAR
jgi:hypothetical protein